MKCQTEQPQPQQRRRNAATNILMAISLLSLIYLFHFHSPVHIQYERPAPASTVDQVKQCSIRNLQSDLSYLDGVNAISSDEFLTRRDRLAQVLSKDGVDAFVLEPGYTFQYYANISQTDWEPWEPEERPFLMLISPIIGENGHVFAKTTFLAPSFEEGRVRMLGIPSREAELDIIAWEEHWNPYETLLESDLYKHTNHTPTLMADEEIRDFIVRGLHSAGFKSVGLSPAAELVRQTKSRAEVSILRAVNTGTVSAVRAMRPCLRPELTEDEVTDILNAAMASIGFQPFFNIVLFEEHGALPHGGFVTGGKKLTYNTMVVIDVGARYLGYSSDICRSFLIDPPDGHNDDDPLRPEKLKVWDIVLNAQTAAAAAMKPGNTAASVDIAARSVIESQGYGYGFTHRLGHGIGIKAHESPYLNKWNREAVLSPGMTFTNEPGIYLLDKFGVRHEDVYLVGDTGDPELLTGRRAQGLFDP